MRDGEEYLWLIRKDGPTSQRKIDAAMAAILSGRRPATRCAKANRPPGAAPVVTAPDTLPRRARLASCGRPCTTSSRSGHCSLRTAGWRRPAGSGGMVCSGKWRKSDGGPLHQTVQALRAMCAAMPGSTRRSRPADGTAPYGRSPGP